jgi:glycosyltransferase involved in cell wall biosynthesis
LDILKNNIGYLSFFTEKDRGNYDAINKGFKKATGDILTWLDSDNYYYDNNVIENIANEFLSDKTIDMVVTNCYYKYENSTRLHLINPIKNRLNFKSTLNYGNNFMPECVFYKKKLITQTGGLNLNIKMLADYDLWIRIFKLNPVVKKNSLISSVYNIRPDALLRKNFLLSWNESFKIGKIYKRDKYFKIRMYFLYLKSVIRQSLVSIINRNNKVRSFIIKKLY